jgi:IclR family acetate operon transcriptional repressor
MPGAHPQISTISQYAIRAVERVCDLLDLIQDSPEGVTLADAYELLSLPKPTLVRYLSTLQARRWGERDEAGVYRPGRAFPTRPAARPS